MQKLISVVVPMYFEEEVAQECYNRLKSVMLQNNINYEFVFVNDGSTDRTMEILSEIAANDFRTKIVNFARNFGHQVAVTAGIAAAKGDAIVIIDADLQDPPEVIPELIAKWEEGYEVVYAKRKQRKGETWFKLLTAKYFYKFLNYMSDIDIPKDTGDFRIIDRKIADVFNQMTERNRFIRGMMSWVGFRQTYVEYERDERFAGETKYPLKKMIKFASDGIIAFSTKPLRIVMSLGLLSVLISIIVLLYTITVKVFGHGTQTGWASIMVAITFFSGIQLLGLGIVGQYIARIYDESKNRPIYIVKETINIDEEETALQKEKVNA
ncbi:MULTISPECIES: glycosyltransferase family 2 protein [Bacillus]|uniref:Glycosyltransferase 2-like domain-containing protein n=1 Tax=Bacillus paranthracis TaxID=2026186 RepID=A0A9X8X1N4_9BACI|nr:MULTISPECIES: glycosyltransferase family 2 protein [Bacillus cereus group]ONG68466.1 glycosyltransferase [Bacillus cereus]MCC2535165.1 glycosyltransferase family 2 protein [Bacillus paranthracis]MCH5438984.1 glycosyltransferase family 2 protein [Bacillus paranthracis]MCM0005305.1 glycosyltransferase family 2 protein [Bacillus paranthracis]MCR6790516.1 glycosyltransferase family 2 protein [Bacillus paranthracis]